MKIKNMFKSLLLGSALLFSTLCAPAATLSLTLTNQVTNLLSATRMQITSIQVTAPSTNTAIVYFYDNSVGSNTFSTAGYTTRTTISTNYVVVFTNTVGLLQTNTYPGIFTSTNWVAASNTTPLPIIASFSVPAGATEIRTTSIITTKGLVALPNTNGIGVVVNYSSAVNQ